MSFEKGKVKAELGGVLTKGVVTWATYKSRYAQKLFDQHSTHIWARDSTCCRVTCSYSQQQQKCTFMHILQLHAKMCNKLIRKLTSYHSSYWCCLHRPCFDLCLKLTNVSYTVYCSCGPSFFSLVFGEEQKQLCEFQFVILMY